MTILVSGSVAFDHIMVFPDRFKNHILPEKLHILNVSFNITSLKTHFGGVAGNIAYHLRLLGDDPVILATVGHDFGPYADWLDRQQIRRHAIKVLGDIRTPQGFVTTDLDDARLALRGRIARVTRRGRGLVLALAALVFLERPQALSSTLGPQGARVPPRSTQHALRSLRRGALRRSRRACYVLNDTNAPRVAHRTRQREIQAPAKP